MPDICPEKHENMVIKVPKNLQTADNSFKGAGCNSYFCYQITDLKYFFLVRSSFEAPNSKPHCSKTLLASFQDLIWAEIAQNQIYKVILIIFGKTQKMSVFLGIGLPIPSSDHINKRKLA